MQEPLVPLSEVERLVEVKVRKVLAEMLGVSAQKEPDVLALKDSVRVLGYQSDRQIYRDIEDGLLRVGIEIEDRRRPGTHKSRYFVNISAARERLKHPPEKRKGV